MLPPRTQGTLAKASGDAGAGAVAPRAGRRSLERLRLAQNRAPPWQKAEPAEPLISLQGYYRARSISAAVVEAAKAQFVTLMARNPAEAESLRQLLDEPGSVRLDVHKW